MHGDHSTLLTSILLLLGVSTLLVTLFYRLRITSLLAFLITGALFGPTGFGMIEDPEELAAIAELGLTFLLFILGLEFSLPRLILLRNTVFKLGSVQVILCASLFYFILRFFNIEWQIALILAGGLSLSSTAVVSGELSQMGLLKTRHGEIAIGILLFQDLVAVSLLIAVPLVSNQAESFSVNALLFTIGEGVILLAAFFFTGRYLLPRLLREISKQKSDQILVLAALVIVLLSAMLTSSIGLSMELGAFLAGMMLGDTRYRHQLEADIKPFRDLLLGLFFITIGMLVDLGLLAVYWPYLLVAGLLLVIIKALMITGIVKLLGETWRSAAPAGLALAQGSEFLFALLALSVRNTLVTEDVASNLITIVIISMVLTPLLIRHGPALVDSAWLRIGSKTLELKEENSAVIEQQQKKNHILILGFGRVGQTIARFLRPLNIDYLVLETDDRRIREASTTEEPIFYGDSERLDILKAAGAGHACLAVITFDNAEKASNILENIHTINPNTPVLVRTRDDSSLDKLVAAGAAEVIPETHEASLTMISHILLMVNYPDHMIHSIIDKARRDRYKMLKGFYQGERTGFLDKSAVAEVIHAITLPDDAYACGRTISQLHLPHDIQILEVHRGIMVMTAEQHFNLVLEAGDILVLSGFGDKLDAGKNYLLKG